MKVWRFLKTAISSEKIWERRWMACLTSSKTFLSHLCSSNTLNLSTSTPEFAASKKTCFATHRSVKSVHMDLIIRIQSLKSTKRSPKEVNLAHRSMMKRSWARVFHTLAWNTRAQEQSQKIRLLMALKERKATITWIPCSVSKTKNNLNVKALTLLTRRLRQNKWSNRKISYLRDALRWRKSRKRM